MAMQVVSGYKLLEVLGEGPRATVYKALDIKSRSLVALKLFHSPEIENAGDLPRLQHPHVATILDVGRSNLQVFAVSEFLPGGTLKDQIRSMHSVGDVLPADQVLAYAEEIAEALICTGVAVLTLTCLVACFVPAFGIVRTDPMH